MLEMLRIMNIEIKRNKSSGFLYSSELESKRLVLARNLRISTARSETRRLQTRVQSLYQVSPVLSLFFWWTERTPLKFPCPFLIPEQFRRSSRHGRQTRVPYLLFIDFSKELIFTSELFCSALIIPWTTTSAKGCPVREARSSKEHHAHNNPLFLKS